MSDGHSPVPEPGGPAPPISRAIYGMAMFATLPASDLDATMAWYIEGLGFISLFTVPGLNGPTWLTFGGGSSRTSPPGATRARTGHLRHWVHAQLRGPPTTRSTAWPDVPGSTAAARVDGPTDTPRNTRDLATTDPG